MASSVTTANNNSALLETRRRRPQVTPVIKEPNTSFETSITLDAILSPSTKLGNNGSGTNTMFARSRAINSEESSFSSHFNKKKNSASGTDFSAVLKMGGERGEICNLRSSFSPSDLAAKEPVRSLKDTNEKFIKSAYATLSNNSSSNSLNGEHANSNAKDESGRRVRTLSEMGDGLARATFSPPMCASPRVSKLRGGGAGNNPLQESGLLPPTYQVCRLSAPGSKADSVTKMSKDVSKESLDVERSNSLESANDDSLEGKNSQDSSRSYKVVALKPSEVSNFFGRYTNRKKSGLVLSPIKELNEDEPVSMTKFENADEGEDDFA